MKGNTQLRQESIRQVLSEIKRNGPISKRELQEITGFSWGKISFISNLLLENGYTMAVGKEETVVGRKPEKIDINVNENYIIGIDFYNAGVLTVVCDLKGRVINKYQADFPKPNYDSAIETMFSLVERAISDNPQCKIIQISVAMQGDVDTENGITKGIIAIDGWRDVPVSRLLYDKFKIPTLLFHDPDCLLYAERFYGSLRDNNVQNVALLRLDHQGIGIAVLLSGEMFTGVNGRKCEIGTIVVPDGNDGYELLWHIMNEAYVKREYLALTGKNLTCDEIAQMARKGDQDAVKIFKHQAMALGVALNSVVSLLGSEKVVVFGEYVKYLDLILPHTQKVLRDLLYGNCPQIVISSLKDDAAAVGAVLCSSDRVIDGLEFSEN